MFIDKTAALEKGLQQFPSIFIEGAAACGKTTAVNMFLKAHPEAASDVFYMDKETDLEAFALRLKQAEEAAQSGGRRFFVFENMGVSGAGRLLAGFVAALPSSAKAIFVSREKPEPQLLELLWNGLMGMVYPDALMFTQSDIAKLMKASSVNLTASDVYSLTGGWPGCINALMHMAAQLEGSGRDDNLAEKLLKRYEIQEYIKYAIIAPLSKDEQQLLEFAGTCPWIDEAMVMDFVQGTSAVADVLRDLQRKGLLRYNEMKNYWLVIPMLRRQIENAEQLGAWYEHRGHVEEALYCYSQGNCRDQYKKLAEARFDVMPLELLEDGAVLSWPGNSPQLCYLRGMCLYNRRDFAGLRREIAKVKRQNSPLASEIYLNLTFVDSDVSMTDWLGILKDVGEDAPAPVRLYHFTENSSDFLTGLREMSPLFACPAKELKARMSLLKEKLGDMEWLGIQLAHMDFDLETGKKGLLESQEWHSILHLASRELRGLDSFAGVLEKLPWRFKMACLYVLNKIHVSTSDSSVQRLVVLVEESLRWEDSPLCRKHLEAIKNIHALWGPDSDQATRWLSDIRQRTSSAGHWLEVTEENYYILFLMVKGLLSLNQHETAGRILHRLIPYVQQYHRTRLLAELMLQQAIVEWADGKQGRALRNMVESFLYTGENHYVSFYGSYGRFGWEVLEAYIEWLRNAEPEKWHRKKKYNYGSVLTMPQEDYLELLLRTSKRTVKLSSSSPQVRMVERLTMMETVVLQNLNKGLTNTQICEALNLKLPTVKTHISNVYKKLGVSSRVQAIMKGKELGILK